MFYSYILYSKSTDLFYKGSTQNIQERLKKHNGKLVLKHSTGNPEFPGARKVS
ncbi:GIY-YIG nuclease family protein [Fluviicola sp.]|uniref:GIY-YIG nuclease family protein n=1 Tax=Fluviicola sp. TaxID=1917219 RepID=UPI0026177B44|nr:GIY-YIG nuclease family protein [Fluviicola sp.]